MTRNTEYWGESGSSAVSRLQLRGVVRNDLDVGFRSSVGTRADSSFTVSPMTFESVVCELFGSAPNRDLVACLGWEEGPVSGPPDDVGVLTDLGRVVGEGE
ncbi:hypothetical protein [Nonomuraea sp. CA-141351]|uniref:hypothetical protein n=1 Tax=Nonomuraea sp. CA-141351 TaxID=3239996 RepID=UPI003D94F81E